MDLLASLPKQRSQFSLLALHMASIINIASWLIVHSTILLTLLTSFFQMIHGLYDYYFVDWLHPLC